MNNDKDPVLAQIESLAVAYTKLQGSHDKPEITQHDFVNGAITQDPIAWNRCLDEVTGVVRNSDNVFEVLELIEKMRR